MTFQNIDRSIYEKQRSEEILKLLTIQRKKYRKSKKIYNIYLTLSIVIVTTVLILALFLNNELIKAISIILSYINIFISENLVEKSKDIKSEAAKIQSYIDSQLFSSDATKEFAQTNRLEDTEITELISECDKIDPNVNNWYSDYSKLPYYKQIFYCQKENIRWDQSLRKKFRLLYIILTIVISIALLCFFIFMNFSLIQIIIILGTCVPLCRHLFHVFNAIKHDLKRLNFIKQLEKTIAQDMDHNKGIDIIITSEIHLQKMITSNRKKAYQIPNWFYKIFSKKQEQLEDKIAYNINYNPK